MPHRLPLLGEPAKERCTGACCTNLLVRRGDRVFGPEELLLAEAGHPWDALFLRSLVPLHGPWPEDTPEPRFVCRYLGGNGDCAIYANRPLLCREHGVMTACARPGCCYDGARDRAALIDTVRYMMRLRRELPTPKNQMRDWIRATIVTIRARLLAAEVERLTEESDTQVQ